jgi:hypothetical protein
MNKIYPDLQVHILIAIYKCKISPNAMHCIFATLDIAHEPFDLV